MEGNISRLDVLYKKIFAYNTRTLKTYANYGNDDVG
jgi:hypothetical protein